jgi:hypothetical protein
VEAVEDKLDRLAEELAALRRQGAGRDGPT